MTTVTQDILPYRLKRIQWESPRNYVLDIHQEKTVSGDQTSLWCCLPLRLTMTKFYEKSAVCWLQTGRPAFNGSRDYDKLQWVFARLMSINDKVGIRIHPDGSVWQIMNEKKIRARWPSVKQQILDMYDDPLVENLVARYEMNIDNHFKSIYLREPLMQLLFNDLFQDYEESTPAETKRVWPRHLGDIPFLIIEEKQLAALHPRRKEAVVSVEAAPNHERMDPEELNDYLNQVAEDGQIESYNFSYDGTYRMDTARGCIREAELKVEGSLGEAYSKKTNYHLICTDYE